MIVKVDLDEKLVWQLGDIAEKRGVTVSVLTAELVTGRFEMLKPAPRKWTRAQEQGERTRAAVTELHAAGYTDSEMAAELGRVREHVSLVRRRLGLEPNRKKVPA